MLKVFTGPMFSGKTTHLMEMISQLKAGQKFERILVAKWDKDHRSGSPTRIETHNGRALVDGVQSFSSLDDVELLAPNQAEMVAVDEAQFFGQDLLRLWKRLESKGNGNDVMIVAGLDLDFKKERFGHVLDLMEENPTAECRHLISDCFMCGGPASYTMRKSNDMDQILVGGANMYQPACGTHHRVHHD